jgi:AraC family transcriptional regulator
MKQPMLATGQFVSTPRRQRVQADLVFTELVQRKAVRMPSHVHPEACVGLVLTGRYRQVVDGEAHDLRRGRAFFHPPAFAHRDEIGQGGASVFVIELGRQLLARIGVSLPAEALLATSAETATLAWRLREEIDADDPLSRIMRESLVLEIVCSLIRSSHRCRAPGWVLSAERELRARPEHRWTVVELARLAGAPPAELSRAFRVELGETVAQRVQRIRLEHARDLLVQGRRDLAEVAFSSGFADQSHLTRLFRRAYGVTPGAFRRRIQVSLGDRT